MPASHRHRSPDAKGSLKVDSRSAVDAVAKALLNWIWRHSRARSASILVLLNPTFGAFKAK
jgi:hypothetical protein